MCIKKMSREHTVRMLLPTNQEKRPQNKTNFAGALILDFTASRPVRNKFLLFKPARLWHLLWWPELTKTGKRGI